MDFSQYRFRASQSHFLMVGTIGLTEGQEVELKDLENEKKTGINTNGNKVKWTHNKEDKLKYLAFKKDSNELPKTMQTELRKIHRAETFKRNFIFTNKYVQKGIMQEEEAVTLYQIYRKEILGINTKFTKNTERLKNDWFSGEWDLPTLSEIKKTKEGFDIKNSWSLDSFPFAGDDLDSNYVAQNQVYMDLTGAEKWTTVYCLVNGTEHLVNNEKQKWFYALNMPGSADDKYYDDYLEKCREVEKMMIFDYERFVKVNPFHNMEISKDEWFGEGFDIPLKDRVVEKTVYRDENFLSELKERATIGRKYLTELK